jgi:hypothetical protein
MDSMKSREIRHGQSVPVLDRQRLSADRTHTLRDIALGLIWQPEPAELDFDRDLPGAGSGQEQLVTRVFEGANMASKPLGFRQQPKEHLGVEQ